MISDLWTLAPSAAPGAAQTLAALGVTSATLVRRNQAAGTLSLTIEGGTALTDAHDQWVWDSQWTLARAGQPRFTGRVADVTRSGAAGGEAVTVELRDLWWDLERTPLIQTWPHLTESGITDVRIPRVRLGVDTAGERQTTAQCLAAIAADSALAGTGLPIVAALPTLTCPPIESANISVAEAIRSVLRWHPGAVAFVHPFGSLYVLAPTYAVPIAYTIGEAPLLAIPSLRPRPDLVVDGVHIHWASEATHWTEQEAEPAEDPILTARPTLSVFTQKAGATTASRRTMVVMLPGERVEIDGPTMPPVPHAVAIKTRPLPKTGATGEEVEKWWCDMLGLSAMGIDEEDVVLPVSDSEDAKIRRHKVQFAWKAADPMDPTYQMPSAINPNSSPVWRPDREEDLPRVLVAGTLAEWMRVAAAELVVSATVAVRKSTVDDLDTQDRARFNGLSYREGVVQGVDAYLIDAAIRVIGTTAKTKLYRNWLAAGTGSPAEDLATELDEAREACVIPGLASALYADRVQLPWEGSITLQHEDGGETVHMGRRLYLGGGRPEWLAMGATIQSEALDLVAGTTRLEIGPPNALGPQDRIEIAMAARRARTNHAESRVADPPPPGSPGVDDSSFSGPGRGAFMAGSVAPKFELQPSGEGGVLEPRQWQLRVLPQDGGGPPTAEIRSGTVTGVTVNGYLPGMNADEWNPVTIGRSYWLKLTVQIEGSPINYYSSPDQMETVYLPNQIKDGSVELVTLPLDASPQGSSPTISPETGAPGANGVYYFRIGRVTGGEAPAASNDYLGPLAVGWCAPDSAYLTQLT